MYRRFSKRRRLRALAVALIDRAEWGPPTYLDAPVNARQPGICAACSGEIAVDDEIARARVGPFSDNVQTFVHWRCPSFWSLLSETIEVYDDKIITKINPDGRGVASGCGHTVVGGPVYLVRKPISLISTGHSEWFCEECVTQGSKDE